MPQSAKRNFLLATVASTIALGGCGGGGESVDREPGRGPVANNEFRQLQTRPLDLPSVDLPGPSIRAGGIAGRCLASEETDVGAILLPRIPGEAALGPGETRAELERGPVYVALFAGAPRIVHLSGQQTIGRSKWVAVKTIWVSRPPYDGPVLIRGGRLEQPGKLGFGSDRHPRGALRLASGDWPTNGTDPMGRKQSLRTGWRATSVPTRIRAPGCYAFQVDGEGFSYVLSFGVQEF